MLLFSHRLILYTGDFFFESCHILNDFFRSPGVYAWEKKRETHSGPLSGFTYLTHLKQESRPVIIGQRSTGTVESI